MSTRFHNRCDSQVTYFDVSDGYFCVCPECDEDLFSFETYSKEQES